MSVYDNSGRLPVQCCIQGRPRNWKKVAKFLRDVDYRTQELRNFKGGNLEVERRYPPYNKTALIQASEDGNVARVRKLVRRGANLSAQDQFGETGLHYAAGNGYYDMVKELVRAGSDIEILDDRGRTALDCCTESCAQQKRGQWEEITKFLGDSSFRQEELSLTAVATEEDMESDLDSAADQDLDDDFKNGGKVAENRFFWVDAVCINQDDLEERSAQVKIMPQVYSKARCVVVWLGDDSQMIFKLLRNVWSRPNLRAVIRRVNDNAERLKELKEQCKS